MNSIELDILGALTQEGAHFEASWSKFMFNMEDALSLKKPEVTKEQVVAILLAGARFQGTGWSTGKASKVLYDLSGVATVKAQIETYRDCWRYTLALLTDVDLPAMELPQGCAEAVFAIVSHVAHGPEDRRAKLPVHMEEESDHVQPRVGWDN